MAVAVVDVEAAPCLRPEDEDAVGVGHHGAGAAPAPHLLEEHVALADVDRHMPFVQLQRVAAARKARGLGIPEVVPEAPRQVQVGRRLGRLGDRVHKDELAHEEVVVGLLEGFLILQVVIPERAQDGPPSQGPLGEERVPSGQQLVAHADLLPDHGRDAVAEHPGLPALRLEVRVPPVEGVPDAELVPPSEELRLRVEEEAGHVRPGEGDAAQAERDEHRHRAREVAPPGHVVTGPDGAVAVRPRKKGPREHKRPHIGSALKLPLHGGHVVVEAVDVVHVPVLNPEAAGVALVEVVPRHGHLRAVEDARLVHVVPGVELRPAVRVDVGLEELRPCVPRCGVAEVRVVGRARPAEALVERPVLASGEHARRLQPLEGGVVGLALDVGVDDRHDLPVAAPKGVQHPPGVGKVLRVPGEVLLGVRVLQVQPEEVVGDPHRVEAPVHLHDVLHVHVVPPRLVLAQRRERGQPGPAGDDVVLPQHVLGRRAGKGEGVQDARLEEPPRGRGAVRLGRGALDPHETLGRVGHEKAGGTRAGARPAVQRRDERHVAVERHRHVNLVLEDVQVVQPVGLREVRRGQVQPCRVLREAREHGRRFEGHVHAHGRGAARLGVRVAVEGLLPEVLGVHVRGVHQAGARRRVARPVLLEVQQVPSVQALEQLATGHEVELEGPVAQRGSAPAGG
mmetsp:Transcript_64894/g.208992  ORF Transcript_64894/g.208992 Transcript_64894/m.208992 type:complete len:680 (+) Transcript_64894:387-2426(+)